MTLQARKPRARFRQSRHPLAADHWIVYCDKTAGYAATLDGAISAWQRSLLQTQTLNRVLFPNK